MELSTSGTGHGHVTTHIRKTNRTRGADVWWVGITATHATKDIVLPRTINGANERTHIHTNTPHAHTHTTLTPTHRHDRLDTCRPLCTQNSHIHSLNSRYIASKLADLISNEIKKKITRLSPTFHSACTSQWILDSETCALTLEAASVHGKRQIFKSQTI